MKKGVAVLKDVRVTAEEAGSYALRVQSASRKLAVADAVLHLIMQVGGCTGCRQSWWNRGQGQTGTGRDACCCC